jgi:hypothetical protein
METSGAFSIYKNKEPLPGLPLIPTEDEEIFKGMEKNDQVHVCQQCGYADQQHPFLEKCPKCESRNWKAFMKQ